MFGLGDNYQANDNQQSGSTASPPANSLSSTVGVARASYPLSPTTPPTSEPSAPTLPTATAPLEVKPSVLDTGTTDQTLTAADDGINGVHLENAYIPADPPIMSISDNDSAKPTASSLLRDNTQDDGLLKLKQQALQSLAPLVDQLDQSPGEKFKTTMMLIQASDNADLVHEAYDAANKIEDEKARAQALLDVVNEINYFTQHHEEEST